MGGHVNHAVVARALNGLTDNSTGFWQYPLDHSDRPAHTHHPFLNVLIIAMLHAGEHRLRDSEEVLKIPGILAKLTNAIAFIDNVFQVYVIERGLL